MLFCLEGLGVEVQHNSIPKAKSVILTQMLVGKFTDSGDRSYGFKSYLLIRGTK